MMVTVMVAVVVIYRGTIYMKKALRKKKKGKENVIIRHVAEARNRALIINRWPLHSDPARCSCHSCHLRLLIPPRGDHPPDRGNAEMEIFE